MKEEKTDIDDKHEFGYGGGKLLFKSVLSKLEEMSGKEQSYYPEVKSSPYFSNEKDREKIIFVFTDGVVKDKNDEFYGGFEDYSRCYLAYMDWMNEGTAGIPVYCIYIGEENSLSEENDDRLNAFSMIGSGSSRSFFKKAFTPEALKQLTMGVILTTSPSA